MSNSARTTTTISSSASPLVLRFQLSAILHLLLLFLSSCPPSMSASQTSLRRGLLRRFGLEHVPVNSDEVRPEIPDHVWRIYEEENNVDWVRHYYPKEIIENHSGFLLSYNLSVAARNAYNEVVTKAILKLRLRRSGKTKSSRNLSIYCLNGEMKEDRLLLESYSLDNITEWTDFDVTAAFSGHLDDVIKFHVEFPEDVELMDSSPRPENSPLIVFSDLSEPSSVRRKRSAQTGNNERKNRKKGRKHQSYEADNNLCRKTELYVDFDELGWQDWIMAPKGYDAFQCQGSCPNPMPAHLNASNHAIIQSLLHSLKPDEVPPPCCVPTETSPLSILYMDVDKVIVIKEYADMRVESCGCR